MKLTYFPVRGRVEPARLMLALAGADYEFEAVLIEQWGSPAGKARMLERTPFGQMPLLEDDGLELYQSQAINRYLARKLGLMGTTPHEQARVDALSETAQDLLLDIVKLFWDPGFAAQRPAHREATRKRLEQLEGLFTRAAAGAGHWVFPDCFTLADGMMAYALETILPLHPGLVEDFPKLHGAMTAFFAADGVTQYVHSDRRPRTWTASMAQFGGKPEETHHFEH
jgi:glutathione S-transferase